MKLRIWLALAAALVACSDTSGPLTPFDASFDDAGLPDAFEVLDVGTPKDALSTPDAVVDASLPDSGVRDSGVPDQGVIECPAPETYDFTCGGPDSCPGGTCVFNLCIGARLDHTQWTECGDDACGPCETLEDCPSDCAPEPPQTGQRRYDDPNTITIWVHGFSNKSPEDIKTKVYGHDRGCPEILTRAGTLVVPAPCGDQPGAATAPNQWASVEYYGGVPDTWMSEADVREIERFPWDGTTTLHRYGLIVAKFIRHKLETSGASFVNIACHSMGCLITRYVLENDLEFLASNRKVVRWFTSAGVLGGARLAYLYTNPTIQSAADTIGLELSDFAVMNPDFVAQNAAVWDHELHEANSPYLQGILMHHVGGTDPRIREALGIPLLDLGNPEDEPNDGIMYTLDEFFWDQRLERRFRAVDGSTVAPTRSFVHEYHMQVPDTDAAVTIAAAALFHRRKVSIRLAHLELLKDAESHRALDGEHGDPPAELTIETRVRFDPYVESKLGHSVLVHEDRIEPRTAQVFAQTEGTTTSPDLILFEGPVFDEMTSLEMNAELIEVDWYPRFDVRESVLHQTQVIGQFQGTVPLVNGTLPFESEYARGQIVVEVREMY